MQAGPEGLVAASSTWGCWLVPRTTRRSTRVILTMALLEMALLTRTTRKSTRMGPVALTKRSTAPGSSSTVEQRNDSMPYACLG